MYENDSILSFHQSHPKKPRKMGALGLPAKDKRDDFIMDTNSSSIVSKRSVEKLYYAGQPEYFRYFVRKFQRRSPLINRGYWLRMRAVDEVVRRFLSQSEGETKRKIVVNLGCGYDPLPFEYLGRRPELCGQATFVDVDYPQLMQKKHDAILANPPLLDLLPGFRAEPAGSTILARAEKYLAIGCDLRQLDKLESVLRTEFNMSECAVEILFTAEVSVAYMTLDASDAVLKWASKFDDVRFCLLEQHLPDGRDHPFARTMLKHFDKLRTPLHAIGTMDGMMNRFTTAGWPSESTNIRSLWDLWSDPEFLTSQQRQALNKIEPFDEWEEFALFGSHYFLMVAEKTTSASVAPFSPRTKKPAGMLHEHSNSGNECYQCEPLGGEPAHRRFGAALVQPSWHKYADKIAIHGGLGTRERLNTCDLYSVKQDQPALNPPPLPTALMCHTITTLNDSNCLLVGGRASPDKASAACWYWSHETELWSKAHDLPNGRYRHVAVPFENSSGTPGMFVFGGKDSAGQVLGDLKFWSHSSGWTSNTEVDVVEPMPEPRFGACMHRRPEGGRQRGILTGGMRQDGTLIHDFWDWEIESDAESSRLRLIWTNRTAEATERLVLNAMYLGRFGAVATQSPKGLLLVGGVAAKDMLTRTTEILNLDTWQFVHVRPDNRPLLVGFTAHHVLDSTSKSSSLLILAGGATCFSFGTYWNDGCVLRLDDDKSSKTAWHLQKPSTPADACGSSTSDTMQPRISQTGTNGTTNGTPALAEIPCRTITSVADFELLRNESRPAIISGLDIGPCVKLWSNEYLVSKIGEERPVVVHSSPSPHMNFQTKNFSYTTQSFGTFLDSASDGQQLYLRALSADKPSDQPTHLKEDFPSIAPDFVLPEALKYVNDNAHSSPLRISGPVTMWLHYDVMANVLCQIRGHKRLLLFPPPEVTKLSFAPGASSSLINAFTDSHGAQGFEALLKPGDVLFIPPLWLHAAEPTEGLSVAVNVFFREASMEAGYATGRDVYGNRDLAAYERGRRDVSRIAKSFDGLPVDVRKFYLSRLANELRGLSDA